MSGPIVRHIRPAPGSGTVIDVSPAGVGWRFLSVRVVVLEAGQTFASDSAGEELVLVPLAGAGTFQVAGERHPVARESVFTQKPHVLYLPPRTPFEVVADQHLEVAIGGAPAEGLHPVRLYGPDELATFVRGGANVTRGVTVTIDPAFATERLIAYEIVAPSGNWSSFPPHRHDGRQGTSYHEESYYFRLAPADGFVIQRLYTRDTDLDVSIAAGDGDLVLVHEGFHTVVNAPGTNAYYLNFLAGEQKPVVQLNDPAYAGIADDWAGNPAAIPIEPGA